MKKYLLLTCLYFFLFQNEASTLERPGTVFPIFQFPRTQIPCIDGNPDDWGIVPDTYHIGSDELTEEDRWGQDFDTGNFDATMTVGWVKGMNRLYFLYEATDNYWDFSENSLHNDILEVVVDGDLSGGPFTKQMNPNKDVVSTGELHFSFHGVHAQNYHIFTPPGDKDWCMAWGCAQWIKDLPYANYAYSGSVKHGESGKLILEFWITPFDYAPYDNPSGAIESSLEENSRIGLGWVTLDYDGPGKRTGAYNVTGKTKMYCDASDLCAFRLMPLEEKFVEPVKAQWTFVVPDIDRRLVVFKDESIGDITSWHWDFGDGTTSDKQHPLHTFEKPGEKTVVLTVSGPDGTDTFARVWDVVVK